MAAKWLRYTWDLTKLPDDSGAIKAPLIIRAAVKEEEAAVLKVTESALSMDTGWADFRQTLAARVRERTSVAFAEKDVPCVVLQYGNRIIGSSVLRLEEDCDNHLVTGPCILHEFRSRGFGASLLGASLAALKAAGLKRAHGVTREKTVTARYLYPKFGGEMAEWTVDLDHPPKIAA